MSQFARDFENLEIQFILKARDYPRCFGYTNNMAVRRQVYDALGGFREDIPLADTDFVLRYISKQENPRIRYSTDVCIKHLEIGAWADWIRKLYLYGKQSPQSGIPLYISLRKRIGLYRYCLTSRSYSLLKAALFFLTVVCANTAHFVPYIPNGGAKLLRRDAAREPPRDRAWPAPDRAFPVPVTSQGPDQVPCGSRSRPAQGVPAPHRPFPD